MRGLEPPTMFTDPHVPTWFLLMVYSHCEQKVAKALQAKGYEVFLPMHTVRRQWSDRVKIYSTPLFPNNLFCCLPPVLEHQVNVLNTPGVLSIYERDGKSLPIPHSEIATLRRITASQYPVEFCEIPNVGDVVEIHNPEVRGVLVEQGAMCRVAIGLSVMGRTIVLTVPLDVLKRVDGPVTPHWSLNSL